MPSPWYVSQPMIEPFDLKADDAWIMAETEAAIAKESSFRPRGEWQAELKAHIGDRA